MPCLSPTAVPVVASWIHRSLARAAAETIHRSFARIVDDPFACSASAQMEDGATIAWIWQSWLWALSCIWSLLDGSEDLLLLPLMQSVLRVELARGWRSGGAAAYVEFQGGHADGLLDGHAESSHLHVHFSGVER